MRFAAFTVLACIATPASAVPATNPANQTSAAENAAKDQKREAPTLRKLEVDSDRDTGWCGTSKGPSKLECLGPGDSVIATVGGEEGMPLPSLCLDGLMVPLNKSYVLGDNRFGFEIASIPPGIPRKVEGHKISLAIANKVAQPIGAKCTPSVTQLVDIAVTQSHLDRTKALLLFLGLSIFILFLVSRFPSLLKEPLPNPAVGPRPWSLGRTQLAWWTAIVFAGWFVILLSTSNYESFTPQALILLGVSVATTATAGAVQAGKEQERAKTEEAQKELPILSANLAVPDPALAMAAGQRLQQIVGAKAVVPVYQKYVGIFSDILKDGDSLSLARLQAVLWTIALGAIFVWQVLVNMAMPAFSKELLFLAGISSGSFLFGKVNERRV